MPRRKNLNPRVMPASASCALLSAAPLRRRPLLPAQSMPIAACQITHPPSPPPPPPLPSLQQHHPQLQSRDHLHSTSVPPPSVQYRPVAPPLPLPAAAARVEIPRERKLRKQKTSGQWTCVAARVAMFDTPLLLVCSSSDDDSDGYEGGGSNAKQRGAATAVGARSPSAVNVVMQPTDSPLPQLPVNSTSSSPSLAPPASRPVYSPQITCVVLRSTPPHITPHRANRAARMLARACW